MTRQRPLAPGERPRASGERVRVVGHAERGVAPVTITSEGLGASRPRASNLTLEGRRESRRALGW